MTPEQFFGRNIGAKVSYGNKTFTLCGVELFSGGGWLRFKEHKETDCIINIANCQIIGRRIKDIPDTLYNVLAEDYGLCHEGAFNKCLISDITMQIEGWELLFDKGYFPNEYFDEFKWCVEAEK